MHTPGFDFKPNALDIDGYPLLGLNLIPQKASTSPSTSIPALKTIVFTSMVPPETASSLNSESVSSDRPANAYFHRYFRRVYKFGTPARYLLRPTCTPADF
ncbi:hypothetical protein KQX54_021389 [Cotesia glomerata]|uniref:Uncharacterized protein n=1 Tax=Cotesia glomerata TaxID=32391 RepID=A0AAV7IV13_COTGL|nr:hypothetical protein KQX54_021389 [Cotesia glomerata]